MGALHSNHDVLLENGVHLPACGNPRRSGLVGALHSFRLRLPASRAGECLQEAAKDRHEDVHFDWNAWCLPVRCLVVQAGRQVSSQFLYLVFRLPDAAMGIPFQRSRRTIRHLGRPPRVRDACAGPHFAWFWQGIDTLFVGFMFLQAVPELQRHFWFKPQIHIFVVSAVILVSLPYVSVGVCAWYFPQYLESFPPAYLRILCWVANAAPNIVDHYATLGLEKGASDTEIKKAYRRLAGRYHPDKVGDDPVALEAFHKIAEANEALVKPELRKEYDELIGNPELHELTPRCVAFVVMMGYWLLHALIDWNDVEGVREQHKQKLRDHIISGGAVDLDAHGLDSRDALVEYCQNEENELPFLGDNGREAVMEMRQLLEDAGKDLKDIPEDMDVLKLLPDPKGPQVKGPEDETTASVQKARAQRAWGPKSKDEAKAMKFKMKRYKKMVKKHEGGMMSSCAVQ